MSWNLTFTSTHAAIWSHHRSHIYRYSNPALPRLISLADRLHRKDTFGYGFGRSATVYCCSWALHHVSSAFSRQRSSNSCKNVSVVMVLMRGGDSGSPQSLGRWLRSFRARLGTQLIGPEGAATSPSDMRNPGLALFRERPISTY